MSKVDLNRLLVFIKVECFLNMDFTNKDHNAYGTICDTFNIIFHLLLSVVTLCFYQLKMLIKSYNLLD